LVAAGAAVGSTHGIQISADYGMNGIDNSSTVWFNVGPPMVGVFLVSLILLSFDKLSVVC
jgi:hypothetical protein